MTPTEPHRITMAPDPDHSHDPERPRLHCSCGFATSGPGYAHRSLAKHLERDHDATDAFTMTVPNPDGSAVVSGAADREHVLTTLDAIDRLTTV